MNEQEYTPEKTVATFTDGNKEYYIDKFSNGPKPYKVTYYERQLSCFNTFGEALEFVIERIGKTSFHTNH